ncbi:MAG: hypothetical protein DMD92_20510, partial [Candidatus Rokuibacteriota bacterium]
MSPGDRPRERDAGPPRNRYAILALIVVAQTVANIGPLGIPAIASLLRQDLGLTLTQAGSFLSAYYIGPVAMSLFAGMLADRWGTAKTLVLGQALIAAGLVAASAAGSYATLITLVVVAGVGYGTLNPASTTAAMSWFPPRQRATVVGLKQVGLPFGGMLGAAILPAVALALGWRLAVAAAALPIMVCAVASAVVYRDPPDTAPARPAPGERGPVAAVLRNRDLWLVSAATLVFAAMQTVWMAFLTLYLQGIVGLTLLAASRYLALAQGGGALGRIAFGLLSDRAFGGRRRAPLLIAGCGSALCSLALALTGPGSQALWLVALALGWRLAVAAAALPIMVCAVASAVVYRDPPDTAPARPAPGERGPVAAVLRNRDLWLVSAATLVFAAMQTVWMAFLTL